MKAFLGVDLGSTTTKAVMLDEAGRIIGRGLTNTRANFEAACAIARAEALADARFKMLDSVHGLSPDRSESLRSRVRDLHRQNERTRRLEALRGCTVVPAALSGYTALLDLLANSPDDTASEAFLCDRLLLQAADLAGQAAQRSGLSYEAVMSAFERALITTESDPTTVPAEAALAALLEDTRESASRTAIETAIETRIDLAGVAGTGYGRHRLPFEKREVRSEILCHGLGAHHAFPTTRTVLDIGGQDTKAIQLDPDGLVTSFQMNDRCAAGCGRYLGYVAEELGVRITELGPIASCSSCPSQINSTCTVFAGAEIRERLALGEKREDVVAGLHRAIVLRALSLLARSGGVHDQLTFSGGVARNEAVVRFLRKEIAAHYGSITINVSHDSILNGAIGAALFARMEVAEC